MKEGECCLVFAGTAQSDSQDNWSYYYSQSLASVRFLNSQSNLICTWTSLNRPLSFKSQKILNWVGGQSECLNMSLSKQSCFPYSQMQKQYAPVESKPWNTAHPRPPPTPGELHLMSRPAPPLHGFQRLFCALLRDRSLRSTFLYLINWLGIAWPVTLRFVSVSPMLALYHFP